VRTTDTAMKNFGEFLKYAEKKCVSDASRTRRRRAARAHLPPPPLPQVRHCQHRRH
jgi:hypothetical protein